jgi:hypothetical protein
MHGCFLRGRIKRFVAFTGGGHILVRVFIGFSVRQRTRWIDGHMLTHSLHRRSRKYLPLPSRCVVPSAMCGCHASVLPFFGSLELGGQVAEMVCVSNGMYGNCAMVPRSERRQIFIQILKN